MAGDKPEDWDVGRREVIDSRYRPNTEHGVYIVKKGDEVELYVVNGIIRIELTRVPGATAQFREWAASGEFLIRNIQDRNSPLEVDVGNYGPHYLEFNKSGFELQGYRLVSWEIFEAKAPRPYRVGEIPDERWTAHETIYESSLYWEEIGGPGNGSNDYFW